MSGIVHAGRDTEARNTEHSQRQSWGPDSGRSARGTGVFLFRDITQKKHAILPNYPIVGHLRDFFENLGEYFRRYFFLNDREEMPFNRAIQAWVYRLAKKAGGAIGFGSTYKLQEPGALIFMNAPFPALEEERQPAPPLIIGEGFCTMPYIARSIFNISGMSFGAISKPAVQALRCHTNSFPTGVTTHDPRLQHGLVVEEKYLRVARSKRRGGYAGALLRPCACSRIPPRTCAYRAALRLL